MTRPHILIPTIAAPATEHLPPLRHPSQVAATLATKFERHMRRHRGLSVEAKALNSVYVNIMRRNWTSRGMKGAASKVTFALTRS
jgi:hypothetical protein